MNKAYLISVSTALALGYSAGFATDNLTAHAATSMSMSQNVPVRLVQGGAAETQLFAWLDAQGCSSLDTDYGENVCDVPESLPVGGKPFLMCGIAFVDDPDDGDQDGVLVEKYTDCRLSFNIQGSFTHQAPQ